MTEREWQTCADSYRMLAWLVRGRHISPRKLRLFAVACCRRVEHLWEDERSRNAVAVAERFADGRADAQELRRAHEAALAAVREWQRAAAEKTLEQSAVTHAREAAAWAADPDPGRPVERATAWAVGLEQAAAGEGRAAQLREVWRRFMALAPTEVLPAAWQAMALPAWRAVVEEQKRTRTVSWAGEAAERCRQSDLLRDLLGNPFRPVRADPSWLGWNDDCVGKLARAVYAGRRFQDLPVLADALEEAGCQDPVILDHCRQSGEHVPGCWAVDLLMRDHGPQEGKLLSPAPNLFP